MPCSALVVCVGTCGNGRDNWVPDVAGTQRLALPVIPCLSLRLRKPLRDDREEVSVARLTLNRDALDRYMAAERIQTKYELAKRMKVSPSTITRLLDGSQAPGPAVLAGFRTAFPGRNTDELTTTK